MGERRMDVEIRQKRMNLPGFDVLSPFSFLLYSFAFLFRFALRYVWLRGGVLVSHAPNHSRWRPLPARDLALAHRGQRRVHC